MCSWRTVKLKDIFDDLIMGQSPESSTYNDECIGLPFVQGNADMDGDYPAIRLYTSDPKKISLKNDILLTVRAPVGDLYFNNLDKISIGRGISAIRINDDSLSKYIYFYLNWNKAQFVGLQQGTTFTEIGKREVRNLEVQLPQSASEQKAISGILSNVDESIKAVENTIHSAEQLKKSLMQNLLTGLLRPDGSQRKDSEMFMTKYGYAPKAWKYCQIKDLIREGYIEGVQDGNHGESHPVSAEFVDEGIPFVMASNISKGFVDTASCKKLTKKRADTLRIGFAKDGDVLLSHKASIGYTCIVEGASPYFMLTPQVTYYRVVRDKLLPEYLKLFFEKYNFQCVIEGLAKQSTRNFIGITNQKKMWIYLPEDINEQYEIISPILAVDNQIHEKKNKIEALKKLKKSLMQNLLTGKVRVDVDKINKLLDKA